MKFKKQNKKKTWIQSMQCDVFKLLFGNNPFKGLAAENHRSPRSLRHEATEDRVS